MDYSEQFPQIILATIWLVEGIINQQPCKISLAALLFFHQLLAQLYWIVYLKRRFHLTLDLVESTRIIILVPLVQVQDQNNPITSLMLGLLYGHILVGHLQQISQTQRLVFVTILALEITAIQIYFDTRNSFQNTLQWVWIMLFTIHRYYQHEKVKSVVKQKTAEHTHQQEHQQVGGYSVIISQTPKESFNDSKLRSPKIISQQEIHQPSIFQPIQIEQNYKRSFDDSFSCTMKNVKSLNRIDSQQKSVEPMTPSLQSNDNAVPPPLFKIPQDNAQFLQISIPLQHSGEMKRTYLGESERIRKRTESHPISPKSSRQSFSKNYRRITIKLPTDNTQMSQPLNLFNLMPQAMIVLNNAKKIVYMNNKTVALFGTSDASKIVEEVNSIFCNTHLQSIPAKRSSLTEGLNLVRNNKLSQEQFENLIRSKSERLQNQGQEIDILDILLNPDRASSIQSNQAAANLQSSLHSGQIACSITTIQEATNILVFEQEYKRKKMITLQVSIIQGAFTQKGELELMENRVDVHPSQYNLIILMQDVTKKRNYGELQRRLRFQNEILQSFSHELRTPLNCSIQLLSVAKELAPQEISTEYINPSYQSNILLLYQINDILDYAAFQMKNFQYNFNEFRFREIFTEIQDLFQNALIHKSFHYSLKCEEELLNKVIYSDRQRVVQVLKSLVGNSLKFTPSGGTIQLYLSDLGQQPQQFRIGIRDDGPGITPHQSRLIKAYLKNPNSLGIIEGEGEDKSVGLGFKVANSIVSGLVSHKRGRLSVKNLQRGLEVSFKVANMIHKRPSILEVPDWRVNSNSSTFEPTQKIKVAKQPFSRTKICTCQNIMVVDDEPFNQLAFSQLLSSFRLKAMEAYNGQEAVQLVEKCLAMTCNLRLIFMDIQMPIRDGISASEEQMIRYFTMHSDRYTNPKIVICSAFDTEQNMKQARGIGVNDFLNKPVRKKALETILNTENLI